MLMLVLHGFHQRLAATFGQINGCEAVLDYGDVQAEHRALGESAAMLDLSFRSRIWLLGQDRERFLNGQVTNDVRSLPVGQGCYAAVVTAKGKMDSDANIYRLPDAFLLDFEPGFAEPLTRRLERYVIADDVRVADIASQCGLLSVQGPKATEVLTRLGLEVELPARPFALASLKHSAFGDLYVANQPRLGRPGFDLFSPADTLAQVADSLLNAVHAAGGRAVGWQALEIARVEAGIPRYGADMDDTHLPPEAGLESRAISYSKGCYIGQEVMARIRTYGQVVRSLRGLRLAQGLARLPARGDALLKDGQPVGHITSAVRSLVLDAPIALGYVRRECNSVGTELALHTVEGESTARIVPLPFVSP